MIKIKSNLSSLRQNLRLEFKFYTKSATDRFKLLSLGEQKLLLILSLIFALMLLYLIINSLMNLSNYLSTKNTYYQYTVTQARILHTQYTAIKQIEPNEFSKVNIEQINKDITQLLELKNVDTVLENGQLSINLNNVEFTKLISFIDHLQKSYKIFPNQSIITRSTQMGYVNCNLIFTINP